MPDEHYQLRQKNICVGGYSVDKTKYSCTPLLPVPLPSSSNSPLPSTQHHNFLRNLTSRRVSLQVNEFVVNERVHRHSFCLLQCSQLCHSSPTGYTCSCRPGFKLLTDGASCEDIDECEEYQLNKCNHFCVNLKGHYKCTCAEGYALQPGDPHTCKPVNTTVKPYLAFLRRYEIRKLATDGSWEGEILRKIQNAVGIDFDWSEQRVYWTEGRAPPRVKRVFFNGTGEEVVLETGMYNVEGLAVDWVGRNMYLADRIQDKIFVATLDGRYMKTLIAEGLQEPRAVVVDPSDGMLFKINYVS